MLANTTLAALHTARPFYVVGGTVQRDATCYVQRQADQKLYEGLQQSQFCYVLTSRQMGKSSLMVRTAARLREEGVGVCLLDLTAIGQNLSAEQWYDGLLTQIAQQLNLEDELENFWSEHPRLGPLQRWMQALHKVVLPRTPGRVMIFVDEIDAVRSLPFSTDEFFAGIREFYNRRTEDPELERLTFCLLGVATPSDLIRDTRTTPFNIGQRVELNDFGETEAATLVQGLGRPAQLGTTLLNRVLYWTGGQPYLTQRLCQALAEDLLVSDAQGVDHLCEELFLSHRAQERDDNLLFVRERILRSEVDLVGLLNLYQKAHAGQRVADDVTNPLISVLRLSGIVRVEKGLLRVRNQIYEQVFDRAWAEANKPDAELRRQRAAYRRGLLRAASVAAIILAVVSGLAIYAFKSRQQALVQQLLTEQQRLRADANATQAQAALTAEAEQRGRAEAQQHLAEQRQIEAQEQRQQALAQKTLAEEQRGRAEKQALANRQLLYASNITVMQQDWETANLGRLTALLNANMPKAGEEDLRGFEWYYLWRLSHRELFTLHHGDNVDSVSFSPDGRRLATANRNSVKLWDVATGRELFTLDVRLTSASTVSSSFIFSPDGKKLTGRTANQTVTIWDAGTGQELLTLKGHTREVTSVAFTPDGKQLATGSLDGTAKLWDVATGQELFTFKSHQHLIQSVVFSPDGKRLACSSLDSIVRLWDLTTRREIITLNEQFEPAFSPDGKKLLTGSRAGPSLTLWDATTGRILLPFKRQTSEIYAVAFSPDGKKLAVGSRDHTLKFWDALTGQELLSLKGHTDAVNSVTFTPDGKKLVSSSADRTVKLWEAATGREFDTLKGHVGEIRSVALSPDGKLLATGSDDQTANLWDLTTSQKPLTLKGHTSFIRAVAFSPDGQRMATGSSDYTVKLWHAGSGQELLTLKGHTGPVYSVAFSPDGKRLVTGGDDRTVKLWDVRTGQELLTLKSHRSYVHSVAYSPDGKRLASGSRDQTVRLWDATTGQELLTLKGNTDLILPVSFSPDGKKLATGRFDQAVKLWDTLTGQELLSLNGHTLDLFSITFSPDGKKLATASGDRTVKLWNALTGQELFTLRGHTDRVFSVAFSPDGKRLATGSYDRTVRLWNTNTGQELLTLKGYTQLPAVAFSLDGKRLATSGAGSAGNLVTLLEAATETEVFPRRQQ